jgi:hypothetical protein
MNKLEIQQRVRKYGKPLDLDKFEWDEKTKTFSSSESYLFFSFEGLSECTFDTGSNCYFIASWGCSFDTLSECTFDTSDDCIFDTGDDCFFKTGINCSFDTGSDCFFKTGINCSFDTGSDCTFDTIDSCSFKTGDDCVIVSRSEFEVIQPKNGEIIQTCFKGLKGHLVNGIHSITGKKSIIADGILSEIISKKGNVYKVINHGETKKSFLIEKEINGKKYYSHGATLREAQEGLAFKISDRDLSKWKYLTLKSVIKFEQAIMLYRDITGACSQGTKYFVNQNIDKKKDKYSITELLEITAGQYGYEAFKNFFNKK